MAAVLLVLMLQICRARASDDGLPVQARDRLSHAELIRCEIQGPAPLDNRYFMPLEPSGAARHELEGTLVVPEFVMHNSDRAAAPAAPVGPLDYFPGFRTDFFTHRNHLVPTSRETVHAFGGRSSWRIILSPGTVWSEPGDCGMSRASFPFTLVSALVNEAHNGLATFVYDGTQVSSLFLQVIQETAPWNKADYWGGATVSYAQHPVKGRQVLATRFAEERRLQIPIHPFSDLSEHVDSALLEAFTEGIEPEEISATGLVWKGAVYLQPCHTRHGEYPHCRYMRHGAFSLTKSMGASIALLRLAEKYGDEVLDLKVADYVSISAAHDGWESVTFADALNMATGVGDHLPERVDPNVMHGDEDKPKFFSFLRAKSRQEKFDVAFSYDNYPWEPGEVARYNSINTFILSAAMQGFLESREGPDADIWEMVVAEVYRPIGIFHAPIMRTIEPDGSRGLPLFGYGLYPNVDDVAKLSMLLQNRGRHQGRQLLHAGRLAEAMYRTEVTGLLTGKSNEYGTLTYHLSFYGLPYRCADGLLHRIPFGTGYGGNHWALLPNGITVFRFTDVHTYGIESMVDAAAAIGSFQ